MRKPFIAPRIPEQFPIAELKIFIDVHKDGVLISSFADRSHTWNRNFWNYILCHLLRLPIVATNFAAGYLSLKRTSAAVTALTGDNVMASPVAAAGDVNAGIIVGTGTTAESFESYAIATLIAHGTTANKLSYGAQTTPDQSYNSGSKTWTCTMSRAFTNTSGGAIVIAEIAIIWTIAVLSYYYMFNRDLLVSTVNVPNNAVATVSYTFTLILPA